MNGVTFDHDDVIFIHFDDEDDGPVRTEAPLPRDILEWMYPDNKALVELNCQMRLSSNAPYTGLRNEALKESIVYGRQEPSWTEEIQPVVCPGVFANEESPKGMDPSAAFTLSVRKSGFPVEGNDSDENVFSADTMKPGPWFRRSSYPEYDKSDEQAKEPPIIIYDDSGNTLHLQQPGMGNYFEAIAAQQADDKTAFKIGHCPYEVEDNNEQDPFHLGPMVGWAPYFLNEMPNAGYFEPEKCLVGNGEQVVLPFVRCLYETETPLALPYRGQDHDFLPSSRTRLRRGIPRKCLGEVSKEPARESISLSEYNNHTGRYKDWNRLLIGLEMTQGQQNRGYYEAAATGLLTVIHFLGRHLEKFGLLPDSEEHDSGISVSPEEKIAFWHCIRQLLEKVLRQQTISMEHIMNGRLELIPRKTSSAETPLTGQPFRQPGMLPENWWIFGREVDKDWVDFFNDHFWGGSILETDMFAPVPAHIRGVIQGSQSNMDTTTTDEGPADTMQRQEEQRPAWNSHRYKGPQPQSQPQIQLEPLNIIARYTMESLREVMSQMYWVLYGIPGEAPVAGSDDYFSKDEYHYLYRLAVSCCRDLRKVNPERLPSSRYSNQRMLRYAGRKYKHPIEEFSV